MPVEGLSSIYWASIECQSNIYRTTIEHLSEACRSSVENLSNTYHRRTIDEQSTNNWLCIPSIHQASFDFLSSTYRDSVKNCTATPCLAQYDRTSSNDPSENIYWTSIGHIIGHLTIGLKTNIHVQIERQSNMIDIYRTSSENQSKVNWTSIEQLSDIWPRPVQPRPVCSIRPDRLERFPEIQTGAPNGWESRRTMFYFCYGLVWACQALPCYHVCQTVDIEEKWYRKILISRLVARYSMFVFYYLEEYYRIVIESPSKIYRKSIANSTNIYLRCIEDLLKSCPTPSEHLSNNYRTSPVFSTSAWHPPIQWAVVFNPMVSIWCSLCVPWIGHSVQAVCDPYLDGVWRRRKRREPINFFQLRRFGFENLKKLWNKSSGLPRQLQWTECELPRQWGQVRK